MKITLSTTKKISNNPLNKKEVVLVATALRSYAQNNRIARANTKGRGEVSGGGKKPWKQKGTGRARASSTRSPLWRGGGITFGPSNSKNFKLKINKNTKSKALTLTLQAKLASNALWQTDEWVDDGKTKTLAQNLKDLTGKILLVNAKPQLNLKLASSNLNRVTLKSVNLITAPDVINADHVVVDTEALSFIEKKYNE